MTSFTSDSGHQSTSAATLSGWNELLDWIHRLKAADAFKTALEMFLQAYGLADILVAASTLAGNYLYCVMVHNIIFILFLLFFC